MTVRAATRRRVRRTPPGAANQRERGDAAQQSKDVLIHGVYSPGL